VIGLDLPSTIAPREHFQQCVRITPFAATIIVRMVFMRR